MVQSLVGGSHHVPRSHQHMWIGMCSLCSDLGLMEWMLDTGEGRACGAGRQQQLFIFRGSYCVFSPPQAE